MPGVDFDRQAVERRDFPIGRRGYDPAAVDAHLRALADELEELQRAAITGGADVSVASTAGTQVQSILQAAETAAAEIERHALENARQVREDADRDAERTREEALGRARQHVSAVAQVTARLLEQGNQAVQATCRFEVRNLPLVLECPVIPLSKERRLCPRTKSRGMRRGLSRAFAFE